MGTLAEYIAVAPTVMGIGDFTLTQVENKLGSIPEPASPIPDPEITKAKIITLFNNVFDTESSPQKAIQNLGGLHAISATIGLALKDVRTLLFEMQSMLDLFNVEE